MASSKVKTIEFKKEFTGQSGDQFYVYKIHMENEDAGEITIKEKDSLKVGSDLNYELTQGKYGPVLKRISESKKNFQSKGGYNQEDPQVKFIGFAISYAKDLYMGQKLNPAQYVQEIKEVASGMLEWMNTEYKKHQETKPKIQEAIPQTTTQPEKRDPQPVQNSDLLSAEQIKLIKTLRGKTKITEEVMRKHMHDKYNVTSTKDLTKAQASLFIDELNDQKWIDSMSGSVGAKAPDPEPGEDGFPF